MMSFVIIVTIGILLRDIEPYGVIFMTACLLLQTFPLFVTGKLQALTYFVDGNGKVAL
jgi:hypothetical protein